MPLSLTVLVFSPTPYSSPGWVAPHCCTDRDTGTTKPYYYLRFAWAAGICGLSRVWGMPYKLIIMEYRLQWLTSHGKLHKSHLSSLPLGPCQNCIFEKYQGPVSIQRPSSPGMEIPMLKIRRSRCRLIFNMGIPILVRRHLYNETAPDISQLQRYLNKLGCFNA